MTDAPAPLSEQDLAAARAELAEGRLFPVWFTAAAVGVPVGGSAKIVSVGEAAEGEFIEVRPTGTRDTVFCSPNELTSTRPPRRRRAKESPPQPTPAQPSPPQSSLPQPSAQRPPEPQPARQRAAQNPPARRARKAPSQARSASDGPAQDRSAQDRSAQDRSGQDRSVERNGAAPPAAAARKPGRSGVARPAEVTVTLSSTADGEWTVEVTTGRKRTVRPTPVQPAEVAKAARSLPAAVTEAIESSLAAARERQAERVERLQAELDAAPRALQDLSG
jgi:hypothetical protein